MVWRLSIWYASATFLALVIATQGLSASLRHGLEQSGDELLRDVVRVVRRLSSECPEDRRGLIQEAELEWGARQQMRVYVRVLDPGGSLLSETPRMDSLLPVQLFPDPVPPGEVPGTSTVVVGDDARPYRVISAAAAVGPDHREARTVQVALESSFQESIIGRFHHLRLILLAASLAICPAVGYLLARHSLRPLERMAQAVAEVTASTLGRRLRQDGLPRELSGLASSVNTTLDRLEESFGRLSRFSADIAHELRTPINNHRMALEAILTGPRSADDYQEAISSSLEDCERLATLIDRLLFVARSEDPGTDLRRETVGVCDELSRIQEFYSAVAVEGGVELEVQCPPELRLEADRVLFQRAVGNLIDNALDHTPKGGRITLSGRQAGPWIEVSVTDTGEGIPPDRLPFIFDRLHGSETSWNSPGRFPSGLGLSIVKTVAALHGGDVEVASTPGEGTRVRLIFPAAPVATPPAASAP